VFSAPLWLFGLLALAIPLLLHLWSRKPRQVIRVGSLRHVDLTADARSWSARLTDPLLLAVRLALLVALVFALAGLRLPLRRSSGTGTDLVLVDPALLDSATAPEAFPYLDSLQREHEPVRLVSRGLPKVQLGDKWPVSGHKSQVESDLWTALIEADAIVGPTGTIHVVARPRIAALQGTRPRLRARIEWHAPPAAGMTTWAAAAWRLGDTVARTEGMGDGYGTAYRFTRAVAGRCDSCIAPPTRPVAILTGDDRVARTRIAAALRAVATELVQPVRVTSPDSAELIVTSLDLTDSLLGLGRAVVLLSPAAIASGALADSIWSRWPWRPLADDRNDPRTVSLSQAFASRPASVPAALGDLEATRRGLLLLALLLFAIERWLATRPGRREV
jgi:hypothetical protein